MKDLADTTGKERVQLVNPPKPIAHFRVVMGRYAKHTIVRYYRMYNDGTFRYAEKFRGRTGTVKSMPSGCVIEVTNSQTFQRIHDEVVAEGFVPYINKSPLKPRRYL